MNLLGALFRTPSVTPQVAPARAAAAGSTSRTIQIRLTSAHLLLRGGFVTDVEAEGPVTVENVADGVLITEAVRLQGPPPMCRLEIPNGATVDLELGTGGLTVREFRGTLRVRVENGGVSVEHSEGKFRVVVSTGRVDFNHVNGDIDILASYGPVTARQTGGGLQAVNTGGTLELEDVDGPVVARTLSGSIDATNLRGTARLSTRSGAVRVSASAGQLTVRTQSGDVALEGSVVAHTSIESYKGNLDVKLGADTNAHLEARVNQGVVRADRIAPLPGSSRRMLRTTVGLGQSRLRLSSGLGVINVIGPPRVARVLRAS